jgi:mono/diheme cytochrome c family protein
MRSIVKTGLAGALFLLVSCQGRTPRAKAVPEDKMAAEIAKTLPPELPVNEHTGKAVYDQYCLSCHQADGSGVPNMHPPLTPGSWVGKEPEVLITILLKGLNGKVEVNGETYKNFMPSHAQLTDEEIAHVLTYIRSNFGNNFDPVTEEMVKKVRNGQ